VKAVHYEESKTEGAPSGPLLRMQLSVAVTVTESDIVFKNVRKIVAMSVPKHHPGTYPPGVPLCNSTAISGASVQVSELSFATAHPDTASGQPYWQHMIHMYISPGQPLIN